MAIRKGTIILFIILLILTIYMAYYLLMLKLAFDSCPVIEEIKYFPFPQAICDNPLRH